MNQEIEISFWHFPDDPEINYNGTLSIIDGSIELILIECPDTPKGTFTLYGFTQKGERITLLDCLCVGRHMSTPGFFKCEIDARYAILGGFIDPSFCKFENAIVKLANIDNWLEKSGFSEYQSTEDTVSLKFSIPDKIDLYIDSDREYAFIFRKKAPLFTPLNEVFLYQEAFLRMQHNSPFTLEFFWEEVTLISSFLTIAYFDQPQILSITFGYKGSQMECKYRGQRKAEYKAKKHKVNFLFTYPMISSNLQDIFKNWKQLGENSESCYLCIA